MLPKRLSSVVQPDIELFLSDVDGSLITPDHQLTPQTRHAVSELVAHGIRFTIVSGRPPKGLRGIAAELSLTLPLAAFNGAMIIRPDLSVIEEHLLDATLSASILDIVQSTGAEVWLYRAADWFIREGCSAHVLKESDTVGFAPIVVTEFDRRRSAVKIVAVSDDADVLARCSTALSSSLEGRISVHLSQPYYLDITHIKANKGEVVHTLSKLLSIPCDRFATLGDMHNDVLMFQVSGISIAMGNAVPDVKKAAQFITRRNDDEGFAYAVESIILSEAANVSHAS